ncbi:MAG: winged helix-turn-helix transcriptional regulator [Candidatus Altiarchaeota archaeon]|nr:winged helix-turn-helix transcriptional regulator [Candidatus Altiarchaeota archaeon]
MDKSNNGNNGVMDLFLHGKPSGIILSLKESDGKYASILSKEVDCTYTHTLKILTQLKRYNLVEFEKDGRIKKVCLTSEGEDVAHELGGLVRKLERISGEKPTAEDLEAD